MRSFFKTFRRVTWRALSALVIAGAILVGVAKLVLPYSANYRPEVEAQLADYLGQPVAIADLTARWTASGPMFILQDVELLNPETGIAELGFEQVRLHYNIWAWVSLGSQNPTTFTIIGTRLLVSRDEDGNLSVEGMAGPAAADSAEGQPGFLPWLVAQGNIHLASWEVSFRDLARPDMDMTVAIQRLRLKNRGDQHFLSGSVKVPDLPDHEFEFGAEWTGMPAEARDVGIYLRGDRVPVSDLLAKLGVQPVATLSGLASFELWSSWEERRVLDITGNISVFDVHLQSNTIDASFWADMVSGFVEWRRLDDGWLLNLDDLEFGADDHVWPAGGLSIQTSEDGYALGADYLRLDDVAALVTVLDQFDPDARLRLKRWAPRGAVRGLRASVRLGDEAPFITASAQLDGIGLGPGGDAPRIEGLTGRIDLDSNGGTLDIYGAQPVVSVPGVFPESLHFDYATGQVSWRREETGWIVTVPEIFIGNDDLDLHARARIETSPDGKPFVDMFATIRNLDVEAAKGYVPTGLLSHKKTLVEWINNGPVSGRITSIAATLYGDLDDWPYEDGDGRFEMIGNLEDVVLEYHPEWPRAEQVDAVVKFTGLGLQANVNRGRIFGTEVLEATINISDVTRAFLTMEGLARGPAADGLRFLRESPLNDRYGEHIAALEVEGEMRADIRLRVPLTEGTGELDIVGEVSLLGNAITEKRWGFAVGDATGTLGFSDEGISAEDISVDFRGKPGTLDLHIGTELTSNAANILEARLRATMPIATLLTDYPTLLPLADYAQGESDWLVRLDVPAASGPDADPNAMIVSSDLDGIEIAFPSPLSKPADEVRPIEVVFSYPQGQNPIRLSYGDDFHGLFEMGEDRLRRGVLHFGDTPPELMDAEGIAVTGHAKSINAADWWTGFDGLFEEEEEGNPPLLRYVDIHAERVSFSGRFFNNVSFKAERVGEVWQAEVAADEAVGRIQLPARSARRNAIVMDLDRFEFPEAIDEGSDTDVDPRNIPELHLFARNFTYAGCPLGEVRLETYATVDGLQVGLFESSGPLHEIRATGDWNVSGGQEYSDFDITFTSENLGKSLEACGVEGVLKGGQTFVQLDAWWEGSPADFQLARLNGELKVSMGSGNMLDVEPGAGRMVGLFSVESLPRRLSLDFSDVLESGFGFDSIEGTFRLQVGNAYTDDIVVQAPSGTVLVSGRTGLADRDYDQEITVKPRISGALPVVAGLALGPPGAAVALVFQNLLKDELSEMAVYRYSVRGSWDDPEIETLPAVDHSVQDGNHETTVQEQSGR
ncbi:MAG: TIGR02099 family protein [Gammaproteobacteria bacterium]|nr:MAG: TIGR02099 family protein [Gammaproteobacteria bacterium]